MYLVQFLIDSKLLGNAFLVLWVWHVVVHFHLRSLVNLSSQCTVFAIPLVLPFERASAGAVTQISNSGNVSVDALQLVRYKLQSRIRFY